MKFYTIGISCIGSGVGESVINSCRLSGLQLKTVGLGTNPFAYGAYACDAFDYTPTIYASDFVDKLIAKCKEHQIDLLIPGRDDEAFIYAKNRERFALENIEILAASEDMISICRDKEKMSRELNPIVDVFVKCYQKDSISELIAKGEAEYPLLAKPRSGFASMGVEIIRNEADLGKISDDHIVQELAVPTPDDPNYQLYMNGIAKNQNPQVSEISIQLVLSKEGEVIGKMASYNKLNNGVPIEILPYENEEIWAVVDKLLPVFKEKGLVGPLNIQGRLTKKGLKIFEMNPRFTGITGLRALMGFNEVEACIKSWLGIGPNLKITINTNRFGIRQTADKVLAFDRNELAQSLAQQASPSVFPLTRTILVTGASGYLGRSLVKELNTKPQVRVIAMGRSLDKLKELFGKSGIEYYDYSALFNGEFAVGNIDIVIHSAFARPHCTETEIAESLAFTSDLFACLASHQIPYIINLSSQSVYGQTLAPLWKESDPVAPTMPYSQAKYASELMLKSIAKLYPHITTTSLRLAAISGGKEGLVPVDLLSKLVLKAMKGEKLVIIGGKQELEIMDVRDAVTYIVRFTEQISPSSEEVYNLGAEGIYNIVDIAKMVKRIVEDQSNQRIVELELKPTETDLKFGMDSSLIRSKLGVTPEHDLESIVRSLVAFFYTNTH
ncbi:NAD-dependent epimerase/dehydratase family protein [Algoriphagus resistens]|uniref:NAD-dependent epimerase/dehydratase family protein n=1 Tax=Algoriphagus resistens TaxID=1750590 RepID=UPI0007169A97|nr:NAD-dependent epimerase/dehydratase family protein [Algoriphagus resistens]